MGQKPVTEEHRQRAWGIAARWERERQVNGHEDILHVLRIVSEGHANDALSDIQKKALLMKLKGEPLKPHIRKRAAQAISALAAKKRE
ncbi:MAG TPA: hypothetical protein VJI13_00955 [Candidatus Norongarragalinales archaeon]|nr:hypothetical protein [Candidatus Norongarragalinales archaeon]